jgi:hypothetical protein
MIIEMSTKQCSFQFFVVCTHLRHSYDIAVGVLDGHAEQRLRPVARQGVDVMVESIVLETRKKNGLKASDRIKST